MDEKLLIQECSNQNRKAQKVFFETYYKSVFRLAKRYLVDHHDTEDIVIIVFNKALKSITHFEYRGTGSLQKWINTITINESIKAIKKIRPIQYQEEILNEEPIISENYNLDIEKVNAILKKMPKGYRTVFNLYAIDEYSHSEIAELLNISRNTSKSQLLKARKFIIQELKKGKEYGT